MTVRRPRPNALVALGFRSRRRVGLCAASLVLLLALGGPAASESTQTGRPFPGGGYFNLACGFSHRNNDDPILFPGQPGRSHNHTYIGNRVVDASTTPAVLRGGSTTCELEVDASTYWVPTLYVGSQPVVPYAGIVYYVKLTAQSVSPFPAGLKMVAGNPNARRAQPTRIVSWSCGGVGGTRRLPTVPSCSEDDALELQVRFPECWNGRAVDSRDHKRHMAYVIGGRCPKSHSVVLPTLILVYLYPPVRSARPSSGRFASHADFMNGWDQDALARLVASLNYP